MYCTNQISDTWGPGSVGSFDKHTLTLQVDQKVADQHVDQNKNTQQGISLAKSFSLNQSNRVETPLRARMTSCFQLSIEQLLQFGRKHSSPVPICRKHLS